MANNLDRLFSALSDPTRRAVIERLANGRATVSELAAPHTMAMPTFLRHIKVLEEAGLVRSVKKGRVRTCHMQAAVMNEMQGWLAWQREVWEGRLDRLQNLAEDIERHEQ